MKKFNIVHVFWSFTMGGAETMLIRVMNLQAEKYNNVHLIVLNELHSEELLSQLAPAIHVHLLNRVPGSKNIFLIFKFNLLLRKICPDCIHCHSFDLSRLIFLERNDKIILTVHGFTEFVNPKYKYKFYVAVSKADMNVLIQSGINAEKICVVHNGVLASKINQKIGFNSAIEIVCVGRLEHGVKGQDILLMALKLVLDQGYACNLTLIGDGKSKIILQRMAEKNGLRSNFRIQPAVSQDELYRNLRRYDIIVVPSHRETFGLVAVEGMIAKIPLVISSASGLLEVSEQGAYASVVVDQNPQEYKVALVKIIESIHEGLDCLRKELDEACQYAIRNYSLETTVAGYERIYEKVRADREC